MEIIENFTGGKGTIFLVLLFLLVLGIILSVCGVKIQTKNKSTGVVCIILGVVFSLFILFLMLFNLTFGFNS